MYTDTKYMSIGVGKGEEKNWESEGNIDVCVS